MLQDQLLKAGTRLKVKALPELPDIGTITVDKIEFGVVHITYAPAAKGASPVTTTYSRGDAEWMISRGLWRADAAQPAALPRLDDDQIDEFLEDENAREIFICLVKLHALWTREFDERHLLEILHSRLDLVWSRANAHKEQDRRKRDPKTRYEAAGLAP